MQAHIRIYSRSRLCPLHRYDLMQRTPLLCCRKARQWPGLTQWRLRSSHPELPCPTPSRHWVLPALPPAAMAPALSGGMAASLLLQHSQPVSLLKLQDAVQRSIACFAACYASISSRVRQELEMTVGSRTTSQPANSQAADSVSDGRSSCALHTSDQ